MAVAKADVEDVTLVPLIDAFDALHHERRFPVNRLVAFLLLTFSILAFAQASNLHIKSGSSIYIEPMGGFEAHLTAAITKKHVPLIVVVDKEKADYVIIGNMRQRDPEQPTVYRQKSWEKDHGETTASISVIDPQSSRVLFAYSVEKSVDSMQIPAESCAKHLKEFIEKSGK